MHQVMVDFRRRVLQKIHLRQWLLIEPGVKQPMTLSTLSAAVSITAVSYIILFIVIALVRGFYPFEMEWIEGAYVDEMVRVADGHPIYGEPSIEFIPVNKTPLYFVLAGHLMRIFGTSFLWPRLLSLFFTAGCFIFLFVITVRSARKGFAVGVIAAGLYAASFRLAGAWMDIAKPDSMFLCLTLAAFFIGSQYESRWAALLSSLLYVLAYYTKQLALPIILGTASVSLVASRGRQWLLWLLVGVIGPTVFLVLDATTRGWFSFYTLDSLAYHAIGWDLWSFWIDLIRQMWPALVISLLYPVCLLIEGDLLPIGEHKVSWQNLGFCGALLLTSWSVFRKTWTYDNGFMPACASLAILTALGSAYLIGLTRCLSERSRSLAHLLKGAVIVLLLCQLIILLYNPLDQIPTDRSRGVWEEFVRCLEGLSGQVLVFNHGFVNSLVDKNTYLHSAPHASVMGWVREPRSEDHLSRHDQVAKVLEEAVERQVFEWIFTGEPRDRWLPYYVLSEKGSFVFRPLTGPPASPEFFFVKNPVARGGSFPLADTNFEGLLGEGWDAPERWGRWTVGHQASMQVALEQGYDYEVTIEAFPFCVPGYTEQVLEARWNGRLLGRHRFQTCDPQSLTFELDAQQVAPEPNQLQFVFDEAISPAEVGLSNDRRPLAVGFTSITFSQKGEELEK